MIGPGKDVDGLHPFYIGGLALKRHAPYFISCTPLGVIAILQDIFGSTSALEGKRVALIGQKQYCRNAFVPIAQQIQCLCLCVLF